MLNYFKLTNKIISLISIQIFLLLYNILYFKCNCLTKIKFNLHFQSFEEIIMKPFKDKIFNGKPSFNKIQSWLEQIQSIENTQRMLLNGGTRYFSGIKLKSKVPKSIIKASHINPIQINNQQKIIKIDSYQDQSQFSSIFRAVQDKKQKNKKIKISSQGTTPRQSNQNLKSKTSSIFFSRQALKLNTKELQFKMKKIKRVQSASSVTKNQQRPKRQKIGQILKWKGQIIQISKDQSICKQNQLYQKKLKTSPSSPCKQNQTSHLSINKMFNKDNQQNHQSSTNINRVLSKFWLKNDSNQKRNLEQNKIIKQSFSIHNLNTKKYLSQENLSSKIVQIIGQKTIFKTKPEIDKRIKLELQIAHKLFNINEKILHKNTKKKKNEQ